MLELTTVTTIDLAHSTARHGAGLFETMRAEDGHVLLLDFHLERMTKGAAFLGMKPVPAPEQVMDFLLQETNVSRYPVSAVRLMAVDRSLIVTVNAWTPPNEDATLMLSHEVTRFSANPLLRFKTISYLENLMLHHEAEAHGVFDSIALNESMALTDGGRTNLFLVQEDRIFTPLERDGCLPGVVRRALLSAGLAEEASLTIRDLKGAEAVFVTSALREILPVKNILGVGAKEPAHPLIRTVQAAYREVRQR